MFFGVFGVDDHEYDISFLKFSTLGPLGLKFLTFSKIIFPKNLCRFRANAKRRKTSPLLAVQQQSIKTNAQLIRKEKVNELGEGIGCKIM